MGSDFKEKSFMNVDKQKFDENFSQIFKLYEKIACKNCDLSSRQDVDAEGWICPHCNHPNGNEQ